MNNCVCGWRYIFLISIFQPFSEEQIIFNVYHKGNKRKTTWDNSIGIQKEAKSINFLSVFQNVPRNCYRKGFIFLMLIFFLSPNTIRIHFLDVFYYFWFLTWSEMQNSKGEKTWKVSQTYLLLKNVTFMVLEKSKCHFIQTDFPIALLNS